MTPALITYFLYLICRSFTSLCYSADGESILAGGQSKFVCIYNIKEHVLMKKFEISCNLSLDAMEVHIKLTCLYSLRIESLKSLTQNFQVL